MHHDAYDNHEVYLFPGQKMKLSSTELHIYNNTEILNWNFESPNRFDEKPALGLDIEMVECRKRGSKSWNAGPHVYN